MPKKIETVELKVSELKDGFGNPRKITAKKKQELKESLEQFGDFGLILIDEDNNLIAGNQRVSIMKEENPERVVLCKRLIGYTEAELRAVNLKDNIHAGEWDIDLLADWTADLTVDLGIKDDITKEEKEGQNRSIEEMEPLPYEKYDYVLIACKSELDFDILADKLGIAGKQVRVMRKKTIKARAVWFHDVQDKLFGGDKK